MERVPLGRAGGGRCCPSRPRFGLRGRREQTSALHAWSAQWHTHALGGPLCPPPCSPQGTVELLCLSFFSAAAACPSVCHLLPSVAFWLSLGGVMAAGLPVSSSPRQGASDEGLLCCFPQTSGISRPTAERAIQNVRLRPLCIAEQ